MKTFESKIPQILLPCFTLMSNSLMKLLVISKILLFELNLPDGGRPIYQKAANSNNHFQIGSTEIEKSLISNICSSFSVKMIPSFKL